MKKVIITGATSFIGEALINRLCEEGYYIYAIIRPNSKKKHILANKRNVEIIEIDMNSYFNLDKIINTECDYFISFAWNGTRGNERNDSHKQQENYKYSMEALNAALRLNCKKIISAGSQAEYGNYDTIISEETICRPVTEYGKSKLKYYENAIKECKEKGVSFKEPRFFSIYGPGDYENSLIISTIRKMLKNEVCQFTESTHMWNFLYISDAIEGIIKLIEIDCADGPYNFASNDTRKLKDFIEDIKVATNSNSLLRFGEIPYTINNCFSLKPEIEKFYSETGWQPKIRFHDGLVKTIDYIGDL